jgi:hypothetical protein
MPVKPVRGKNVKKSSLRETEFITHHLTIFTTLLKEVNSVKIDEWLHISERAGVVDSDFPVEKKSFIESLRILGSRCSSLNWKDFRLFKSAFSANTSPIEAISNIPTRKNLPTKWAIIPKFPAKRFF